VVAVASESGSFDWHWWRNLLLPEYGIDRHVFLGSQSARRGNRLDWKLSR
jgi:hypothetical protein